MKIILSRKGFDSSAGGVPSPILPGGQLLSLPIPDPRSTIRYREIGSNGGIAPRLVDHLTHGRIQAHQRAHLDPDLERNALPRQPGWRPLFGQSGAAQGHLRNQQVTVGDLFLFFGLFQRVEQTGGQYRFVKDAPKQHILFGWLQIGAVVPVDECNAATRRWADYHPHFNHDQVANNTLYLAARFLDIGQTRHSKLPGAGLFSNVHPSMLLTAPAAPSPTYWRLPRWFYPGQKKPPLTYHTNPDRWQRSTRHTDLRSASRGQEFVLDTTHYPQSLPWLQRLLQSGTQDESARRE